MSAPSTTSSTASAAGSPSGWSEPPPGETSTTYWLKVSAKPRQRPGQDPQPHAGPAGQVGGGDVAQRAGRDHGVRLGEPRPVRGQRGLRRQPAPWARSSVIARLSSAVVLAGCIVGHGYAAQPGLADHAGQPAAGVRRDRVAVVQLRDVHRELLVGCEPHQVGVGADLDPALVRQPDPVRRRGRPSTAPRRSATWPRARAPVHTAESPSWTEAMPPHAAPKSPPPCCLRSAVHGEWSETTKSMSPAARAAQSASRLAASRIGGQHLSSVAPSAMCSASKVR